MKQYNTIEIKTFYILYFNKAEMPRHVLFEEISEEHDQFSIICQSQSATDDYTLKDHVLSSKEKVICCSFLFFKMYIFSNYFHSTTFPRSTCTETFFYSYYLLLQYYYSRWEQVQDLWNLWRMPDFFSFSYGGISYSYIFTIDLVTLYQKKVLKSFP